MKILFWQLDIFSETVLEHAFHSMGIELVIHKQRLQSWDYDEQCMHTLTEYLSSSSFDCIFTLDYAPIISRVCQIYKVPYLCWVVDSPCIELYSPTITNPVNKIFIFDYALYQKFYPKNPNGIFYLALGSDITTFDNCIPSQSDINTYSCDISFVGSLYTQNCFFDTEKLPPKLNGYLKGLCDAQLLIQGYNFLEDVLTVDICNEIKKHVNLQLILQLRK